MANMQRSILIVPTEHPQCRKITGLLLFCEVSKRDIAMIGFAVRGDEQQIVQPPSRLLRFVRRLSFLVHERAENAAQSNNWQPPGLEVYEENAPGLLGTQGTQLFDIFDLCRCSAVEA